MIRPSSRAMPPREPSPRQMWRSEPHTLARVTRTTMAPGSGSGTGRSASSNGLPGPKKSAALPVSVTTGHRQVVAGEHGPGLGRPVAEQLLGRVIELIELPAALLLDGVDGHRHLDQ